MTAPVLDPADLPEQERPAGWPVPADEPARLAALRAFGVLDQPRQGDLDAAARLAAYVCGTPTAVINLIDADRQWQAAAHGTEPGEVLARRRDVPAHRARHRGRLHPDASDEALFAEQPVRHRPDRQRAALRVGPAGDPRRPRGRHRLRVRRALRARSTRSSSACCATSPTR